MLKMNESVKMIVTLIVIAVVVALALSGVNGLTKAKIEQNSIDKLNKSLQEVMVADSYDVIKDDETGTVYEAKKGGETVGYCVQNTVSGYGGDLTVLTGVYADGTVSKVEILAHGETPGLGAKSTDDSFKGQYVGKTAGEITVVKNSPGAQDIQAISGATITSNAVTEAVNQARDCIKEATK